MEYSEEQAFLRRFEALEKRVEELERKQRLTEPIGPALNRVLPRDFTDEERRKMREIAEDLKDMEKEERR